VNLRLRNIVAIGRGAGDGEGWIVFAPDHQRRWPRLAQPVLPFGIGRDVGPVIQEQRGLDLGLARGASETRIRRSMYPDHSVPGAGWNRGAAGVSPPER
jgi:hypothetical protein